MDCEDCEHVWGEPIVGTRQCQRYGALAPIVRVPDPCHTCDGYGLAGYDHRGRPDPCPSCGGTGRRKAA